MSDTRVTTIRMPEQLAADAELIARIDGITLSELIRDAIQAHLKGRIGDASFRLRLSARIEQDRHILERLEEPRSRDAADQPKGHYSDSVRSDQR